MIIGVDARPLSSPKTGIGIYLYHLLDALQEIDKTHRYVLISNAPIDFPVKNRRWKKVHGRFHQRLVSTPWMQTFAPVIVRRENIGLFWGPRHHLPLLLNRRVRTVLTVHDIVHRRYPETMTLPNLVAERILAGRSMQRADAVITDASVTVNEIADSFKISRKKMSAIHPGTPVFDSGGSCPVDLPERYFLFVGTLDPRKNFRRIFEAFTTIDPAGSAVDLVIVGGHGWKNEDFLQNLESHPLRSRVHLTGYVPRSELAAYYRNAIGLLFPSLYEGFGFPILEAMSLGCPVITSNLSSMPEVAGDAALLVNPLDRDDIALAMKKVINSESLRYRLKKKGIGRAGRFSWRDCAEKTLKVFEKACSC